MLVAGAGLAGLTAAYDLAAMGAAVTVIEARDRLGGRVWTIRDGFADRQHAEAGGDMIDESQHEIRQLADTLGLKLTRILRSGFGYARASSPGRPRVGPRTRRALQRYAVNSVAGRTEKSEVKHYWPERERVLRQVLLAGLVFGCGVGKATQRGGPKFHAV